MFPIVIKILKACREPVSVDGIANALAKFHPQLALKSQDLERDVAKHLEVGRKFGLITVSDNGFKLLVNLDKREDARFESRLRYVKEELEARNTTPQDDPVEEPSGFIRLSDQPSRTPTLDRLMRQVDCGPGWNRRSPQQRRAIAIRRRMAAQEKAREMLQKARPRRRSRSRSRSRSGSRRRVQSRSRSRSRSRSSRARG